MGTRGFVGFFVGGECKVMYNHYDSYPSGLGVEVLEYCRTIDTAGAWPQVRDAAKALVMITDDQAAPPPEVIAALGPKYGDPHVGGPIDNTVIRTWYQLLRKAQGDLDALLDAGYMTDASDFPFDSLFCEWGYLVNLDGDGSLEVYRGFQTADHDEGLWGKNGKLRPTDWKPDTQGYGGGSTYWPVKRVASWPLFDLPTNEAFVAIDTEED